MDGSALLTGWLLAMTLPPWAPWWIGVVGSGLAIILGKQVYGGLGQNLFNPAMLARVALLISFPIEMTTWANVSPLFFPHSPGIVASWHITFSGLDNIERDWCNDAGVHQNRIFAKSFSARYSQRLFRDFEFYRLDARQPRRNLLAIPVTGRYLAHSPRDYSMAHPRVVIADCCCPACSMPLIASIMSVRCCI